MPIYEYQCQNCNNVFESISFSTDTTSPACPKCKKNKVTRLISTSFIRPRGIPKGSGGFSPPVCKSSGSG